MSELRTTSEVERDLAIAGERLQARAAATGGGGGEKSETEKKDCLTTVAFIARLNELRAKVGLAPSPKVRQQHAGMLTSAEDQVICQRRLRSKPLIQSPKMQAQSSAPSTHLNAVWMHGPTKARLYIGNEVAAKSKAILRSHGIGLVVICAGEQIGYHMGDETIQYIRFHVGGWQHRLGKHGPAGTAKGAPGNGADNDGMGRESAMGNAAESGASAGAGTAAGARDPVLDFFAPLFKMFRQAVEHGHSVLVHCLAGAHRAGTVGIALCMELEDLRYEDALAKVQLLRPVVNPAEPMQGLDDLLRRFERARADAAAKAKAKAKQ